MRSSSHFLWQLIQSLSSSEKLFFKRNFISGTSPDQRIYIKLFNAIAAQKEYDEDAILQKFQPALNKKNIASQKHYLQQLICEAIIQYDSRSNANHEIYNQVLLIRVYRKKGLLEEAHAIWKKAVVKARQSESFALLNMLKTEFEKMILFSSMQTSYDDLHSIFKGNIITYAEYAEMITLRDIYAETLLLKRKSHFDLDDELRDKIEQLLQRVNAFKVADAQSFWHHHYYRMSKATLLYLLNDTPEAMRLLREVLDNWKRNTHYIQKESEYYIELLYMIAYTGILEGSYKFVLDCFNDNINELIEDPALRANFEAIQYITRNRVYNKMARYAEVEKLVRVMKTRYRQWEPFLNTDLNRTLTLSVGIASFILEQYDDALYFTRRGAVNFQEGSRQEHAAVAYILLLLITYSMNNQRLFDAQYRMTYTFFYKRKKKQPFESALVQCLHRTFYMKDNKSKIAEFQKALQVFEENKDEIVQQMTLKIFNYHGWLISKLQRIPYREYVKRKIKAEAKAPAEA